MCKAADPQGALTRISYAIRGQTDSVSENSIPRWQQPTINIFSGCFQLNPDVITLFTHNSMKTVKQEKGFKRESTSGSKSFLLFADLELWT